MTTSTTQFVELEHISCWCGTPFAAPRSLIRSVRGRGDGNLYCPHGHSICWKKTDEQKRIEALESELDAKKRLASTLSERLERAETDAEHQFRRANGYKGALTVAKKRVGSGICPCCSREFQNLKRHMATKHPDYAKRELPHEGGNGR